MQPETLISCPGAILVKKGNMRNIEEEWVDHIRITEGPDFEKKRIATMEWLKLAFPDYEHLLGFAIEAKMTCVDQAAEICKLKEHVKVLHMDQSLMGLLMENTLKEPALSHLVERLADRETDLTKGVASKAIALTRLQYKNSAKHNARLGGLGRTAKLEALEVETIRLYKAGTWRSAPLAAENITPLIVEMSKNGNGDLLPSTGKPLAWIRAHIKATKM